MVNGKAQIHTVMARDQFRALSRELTVSHNYCPSTLTHFPVLCLFGTCPSDSQ
jgi:hypothetical protein